MATMIRKWGNSPAIRLTTSMMKAAAFDLGQKVVIHASKGRIVIESAGNSGCMLEVLMSGINDNNLHQPVDFGRPAGRERL